MTINHEKKLIFIHIPKNAGTSIIECLGHENLLMDVPLSEYKKKYEKYWNIYTKFAVVRDPIDRFISTYKFILTKESSWFSFSGSDGLEKHNHYDICNLLDINQYINYIYHNPQEVNIWLHNQNKFLRNENNEIEIDLILYYENLKEDLQKISINNIKWLNKSDDIPNKITLTNKSKYLLSEIYDDDYQIFGYKKKDLKLYLNYV